MLIEKEIPGRKGGKKRNRALKILLAFCSLGALAAAVYTHSYVTRISSRSLFSFFFFFLSPQRGEKFHVLEGEENAWVGGAFLGGINQI